MNKLFVVLLFFFLVNTVAAQSSDALWKIVSDKINSSSISKMYVLIGDSRGTVYQFAKGKLRKMLLSNKSLSVFGGFLAVSSEL